jgi:glucan endo-1,3-alpha-glucosidase
MFTAAQQLGTNFKLFFSLDLCCGLTIAESRDMMTKFGNHPNYFKYNNQQLLTTFIGQGEGEAYWTNLLASLPAVLFVPNFATVSGNFFDTLNLNFLSATYTQISTDYNTWWKNVVEGLAYFPIGAMPQNLASTGESYAQLMREKNQIYFAGVSPYFWEGRLVPGTNPADLPRRYYEYQGGEGVAAQWLSIINVQKPTWVELVTWNDFTESYMSPADPAQMPIKQYFFNVGPLLKSHAGYAELQKYYIEWFKSGAKPTPNQDALYYFYLTQPKNLSAPNDTQNIVQYGTADTIYVTTNLTSAATLNVTTGGALKTFPVAAGLSHTRIPFNTGSQHFTLVRSGKTLIDLAGDAINATSATYNFTTTSGFGYGPVIEKSAPTAPVLQVK